MKRLTFFALCVILVVMGSTVAVLAATDTNAELQEIHGTIDGNDLVLEGVVTGDNLSGVRILIEPVGEQGDFQYHMCIDYSQFRTSPKFNFRCTVTIDHDSILEHHIVSNVEVLVNESAGAVYSYDDEDDELYDRMWDETNNTLTSIPSVEFTINPQRYEQRNVTLQNAELYLSGIDVKDGVAYSTAVAFAKADYGHYIYKLMYRQDSNAEWTKIYTEDKPSTLVADVYLPVGGEIAVVAKPIIEATNTSTATTTSQPVTNTPTETTVVVPTNTPTTTATSTAVTEPIRRTATYLPLVFGS